MRTKLIISTLGAALVLLNLSFAKRNTDLKPAYIFHLMYDSIKNIRTIKQQVWALERIDKKFSINSSEVKIQIKPHKVFFYNPVKKLKILYDSETNPHKALVKPNVFPYMTISLDPLGNLMRRNQHYTLNELGYDFIGKSIALTISKDYSGLDNFVYKGKVIKNGHSCFLVEYENDAYSYINYTVGEKESATFIAYKLIVNDYLLRHKNDLLNDFGYLKKGSILKVPNLYCKKAVLYIHEKMMLPVALSLYDDTGLFESYEFTQVEINKPFKKEEFSPGTYGF